MESTISGVGIRITIYVADIRHGILPPGHQPQLPLTELCYEYYDQAISHRSL